MRNAFRPGHGLALKDGPDAIGSEPDGEAIVAIAQHVGLLAIETSNLLSTTAAFGASISAKKNDWSAGRISKRGMAVLLPWAG
jgi:hypothetical protein